MSYIDILYETIQMPEFFSRNTVRGTDSSCSRLDINPPISLAIHILI